MVPIPPHRSSVEGRFYYLQMSIFEFLESGGVPLGGGGGSFKFQFRTIQTSFEIPSMSSITTCRCSRSGCIKKYCICFAAGNDCGKHCRCVGCHNVAGSKEREDALNKTNRRPPQYGCHCKKSKCLKKYCACFSKGAPCNPLVCKCVDCENATADAPRTPVRQRTHRIPSGPRKKQRTCPAVVTFDTHGTISNIQIIPTSEDKENTSHTYQHGDGLDPFGMTFSEHGLPDLFPSVPNEVPEGLLDTEFMDLHNN